MKITVMAMGKPRQDFILSGWQHYQIRLRPLLPVEWVFLPDPCKGKSISQDRRVALEGEQFLSKIGANDALFLLDERGSLWTSVELSKRIYSELTAGGQGRLIFLIGGPYGVSPALRERADVLLSLSKLTLTHEMALLLLSEQIYRAAMIREGSKYHH
ncbi:MAG: 23S rRNA (pseudouridine(1915)-N(3))-methyltransferase RlmH [Pyramidobacter sp.]|nr:23S rRNA (pseudouridine(1915)-N(3))-methyltransferase RlmH [Pyramidobacter sp.]